MSEKTDKSTIMLLELKMKDEAQKVIDESLPDDEFILNLRDLCLLNKLRDSCSDKEHF